MANDTSFLNQPAMISAKRRKPGFFLFRQRISLADQMDQTCLALVPFSVKAVTVADQDAVPVLDQLLEGLFRSVRIDAIKGNPFVDHGPQQVQIVFLEPGGFIDVVAPEAPGDPVDVGVNREKRRRGVVDQLLDGSGRNGNAQYGFASLFDIVAAHRHDAAQLTNYQTQEQQQA